MAAIKTVVGTNGPDVEVTEFSGELELTANFLQGDDVYRVDADLSSSLIGLDGGNDDLVINSTDSKQPTIRDTTVRGGDGDDFLQIFTQSGKNSQVWGDRGSDYIQLSSSSTDYDPLASPSVDKRASYDGFTIYGDNGPVDPGAEGIDVVYIDSGVKSFRNGFVDLEGNNNSISGALVDSLIDAIGNGDSIDLEDLGLEGMLVQAAEVFQSTFRGGGGSDVILFDSLLNPAADTTALDSSVINGNGEDDIVAIARNIDKSTVSGGAGDDIVQIVSGTARFTRFNGNNGSDTVTVLDLLSQNSTFFGGKGDDVLTSFAVESTNSLYSGDLDDDKINFFAVQSTNTTLAGGAGDDEIDDYSGALRFIGNVLDGGDGDDTLRQAANILIPTILDFGATFIGGKGADVMTGDSNTQPLGPKGIELGAAGVTGGIFDNATLVGVSSDLFSFAYGDSVINAEGVGADTITDFDSNASFYIITDGTGGTIETNGDPANVFDYFFQSPTATPPVKTGSHQANDLGGLTLLQRDEINLTTAAGVDVNIKNGISGVLTDGAGAYSVNSKGLVNSGVDNVSEFVEAGNQQAAGAALIWTQYDKPFERGVLDIPTGIRSWLFLSDGIAFDPTGDNGDILVALDNVGGIKATGGLQITGGDITGILVA
jgi:hypothetical protein